MLVSVYPRLVVYLDREVELPEWKAAHSAAARQVLEARLQAAIPGLTIEEWAWMDDDGGYDPSGIDDNAEDGPDRSRVPLGIDPDTGEVEWGPPPTPTKNTPPPPPPSDVWEVPRITLMVDVPPSTTHDDIATAITQVFDDWKGAARLRGFGGAQIVRWVWKINTNLDQRRTAGREDE